jgi:CMP-N-acetylneuraminic acid synthetase
MIDDKLILAIVPARGGSKGLKLKNLQPILGIPMISYAGNCISSIKEIDRAIVSTDNDEIAKVAKSAGLDVPFRRPEEISDDYSSDIDVLIHAVQEIEKFDNKKYDIILMLQPTSPLRKPEHIISAISMLVEGNWDAVWTVSQSDSKTHPLKQLTINGENLSLWDPSGKDIVARQQLDPIYHRNGVVYAFTRECILKQKTILGKRTGALPLNGRFVSIDTEWDIQLVEFILSKINNKTT